MDVGINYPWGTHRQPDGTVVESSGWDFGEAPARWGLPDPRQRSSERFARPCRPPRVPYWRVHLHDDLREFARIGIKTVRFAILFNGQTYGTGADAPRRLSDGRWDFVPRPLSSDFQADWRTLVRTFADYRDGEGRPYVRLMPCLFGFDLVRDPSPAPAGTTDYSDLVDACGVRYVAGRRGAAFSRAPMPGRDPRTRQQAFLSYVVDGLLSDFNAGAPLADCHDVIHSIDLCGEPEGMMPLPRGRPDPSRTIALEDMVALLDDGIHRIQDQHGIAATVGFQLPSTTWGRQLRPHLGQFHYYDGQRLPLVRGGEPAIIGEAATAADSPFDPRLPLSAPPLLARLEWFERLRYREVLLWSSSRKAPGGPHSWTAREADQISRFVRGQRLYRGLVDAACCAAFGTTTPA